MNPRERFSDTAEALLVQLRKQGASRRTLVTVEGYLDRIMREQYGDAFGEALGDAIAAAYRDGYDAGRLDLADAVAATREGGESR